MISKVEPFKLTVSHAVSEVASPLCVSGGNENAAVVGRQIGKRRDYSRSGDRDKSIGE